MELPGLSDATSQVTSASALGLSRAQTMRFVVVPQAVRRVIPPLLNDFVSLLKDTGLMVAAYHSAAHQPFKNDAYPTAEHRAAVKATDIEGLLAEAEEAVRKNDQGRAAAAIALYGEKGGSPQPVMQRMLKYTISEDGRLHGEKFYHTVREEYAATRPAFRNRQLVALARVTASAYGYNREDKRGFHAPGYEDACRLLGVEV